MNEAQSGIDGIAIDQSHVYFSIHPDLIPAKVRKDGQELVALAPDSSWGAGWAMAVDDATLYVTNNDAVLAVPTTGGQLSVIDEPLQRVRDVAVDETHVYWATEWDNVGVVAKRPKAGGDVTVIAQQAGMALTVDGSHVWWLTYEAQHQCHLWRAELAGGGPSQVATIAADQSGCWSIDQAGSHVYVGVMAGQVVKVAKDGSQVIALVTAEEEHVQVVATDGARVYWAGGSGEVRMVSVDGGTPSTLASVPGEGHRIHGLEVDATTVFFSVRDASGSFTPDLGLWSVAKPVL